MRRRLVAVILALLCGLPVAPGRALARVAPVEEATNHAEALARFREGKQHYSEQRYREAAAAFERSLASTWSIEAAYNMALSLDRAGEVLAASAAYRQYLVRAAPDDKHRPTAQGRREQLRQQIGEVLLQLESAEALQKIEINGVAVAKDAFPWFTNPGPLEVTFIGDGPGQVKHVAADVRPGGTVTIVFAGFPRVAPPPEPVVPAKTTAQPPSLGRQRALKGAFWASSGVTLAGGVALAVFGGLSLYFEGRRNDLAELCPKPCTEPSIPDGAQRSAEVNGVRANAMLPVVLVFGVTALALGVTILRERPREAGTRRARVRWLGDAMELRF